MTPTTHDGPTDFVWITSLRYSGRSARLRTNVASVRKIGISILMNFAPVTAPV
jgi:hypothetical protein